MSQPTASAQDAGQTLPSDAKFKSVSYSYPSSDNAKRFGHPKGCYCVEVIFPRRTAHNHNLRPGEDCYVTEARAGYATEADAVAMARKLTLPWMPSVAKAHPEWVSDKPAQPASAPQPNNSEILDLLCRALPFVEDAEKDPAYKKGVVSQLTRRIRAAIEAAEPATLSTVG